MGDHMETRPRADSAEVAFRKIFIGGLSYSTDEEKLKKYFKQYGNVQDAVVMKDPVSKRSRGFGFITFVDIASVDNALANEPHTIDSRKVEAKRAVPRSEINRETNGSTNQKSLSAPQKSSAATAAVNGKPNVSSAAPASAATAACASLPDSNSSKSATGSDARGHMEEYAYNKIFVGGLHYDTRDADFRSYFEKYGRVISAEVMFNRETHKSRGFGFIVFEVENSAVKVCNVKEHSIDGKVVEVKRAIPRSRLPAGTPTASINAGTYKTPAAAGNAAISSTTATSNAAHSAKAGANAAGPGSSSTTATGSSNKSAASGTSRKAYSAAASGESSGASALASGPTTAPVTQPLTAPALTPATSSRTVAASTSYAAALKGASGAGSDSSSSGNILSATIPHRDPAAPHIGNSGMNLLLAVQRPSRSNSESVGGGKFEGSSALNGDSLPLDSPMLSSRNANAGTISNASSRSNSIVQAPSGSLVLGTVGYSPESSNHGKSPVTLGNLPWLSSPPSNPLDPTGAEFGLPSLPPASDHHRQPGANSTESHHSGNRSLSSGLSFSTGSNQGMHGSNGLWFPSPQMTMGDPQQQQQAQQYMGGPFGGGMMFNPYMAMGAPPGMAPSPEAWTAMIEQHQQQQHAGLMNGQFPPPYIVPTAFPPFYSPDGYGSAAGGPSATPQQQQQHMMYLAYHHHQMMQYQNHMAMVHQAQMQQQALGGGSSGNSTGGSAGASATPAGADQQQKNFSNTFNSGNLGNGDGTIPGVGAALASAAAAGGKSSEQTESDDLFNHFNELTLDSATFDPMSTQPWASRR